MRLATALSVLAAGSALAATEEQIHTNFTAAAGGSIVVDVDFGSIEVTTNAAPVVSVDVWRKITRKTQAKEKQFLADNPVTFTQEQNTVTIRSKHREGMTGWLESFSGRRNRNEAKYVLHVPPQFNARLGTSGGGIVVSDLAGKINADTSGGALWFARVQGPLQGDTSGGGIQVSECEGTISMNTSGGGIDVSSGAGSFKGETSGGPIAVRAFKGPVAVDTSGGGITVENVTGKVLGSTSGGSIEAVLPLPVAQDVRLTTSGGGITVRVPPTAAFNLDAETTGGSVRCELAVTVQGTVKLDRLKGPVNGGGPTIYLETSGGDVRVQKD
jgi:hypothetical protein